ncbi:MAG: FAD/FMN-containing dehydrogenase, partial [Gammaproteobacteria bacterium]
GLGGYLLGGGIGWNMPEWGLACRSVIGAELITADGEKIIVSENENKELLWAMRGVGPGFFAAVVRYKLQLYPVHKVISLNKYVLPIEKLKDAIDELKKISKVKSRRLEVFIKIGRFYPNEKAYPERDLVCTVGFFAFADSDDEVKKIMRPVVRSSIAQLSIVKKENIAVNYDDLYSPPATDHSSPNRTAVENVWTDEPGKALMLLSEKMKQEPPSSARSFILCGWGFNNKLQDPDICARTDATHYLSWYMLAEKEEHIEPNYKWMDESLELIEPITLGRYINEIDPLRYPHQVQECFSESSWNRLKGLRKKYDPQNVFHTYLGHI